MQTGKASSLSRFPCLTHPGDATNAAAKYGYCCRCCLEDEEEVDGEEEGEESTPNQCILVWQVCSASSFLCPWTPDPWLLHQGTMCASLLSHPVQCLGYVTWALHAGPDHQSTVQTVRAQVLSHRSVRAPPPPPPPLVSIPWVHPLHCDTPLRGQCHSSPPLSLSSTIAKHVMSPSRCYSQPFVSTPPCPQVRAGATEEEQRGTLLGLGAIGANHGGGVSLSALPTVFCCIAVVFCILYLLLLQLSGSARTAKGICCFRILYEDSTTLFKSPT